MRFRVQFPVKAKESRDRGREERGDGRRGGEKKQGGKAGRPEERGKEGGKYYFQTQSLHLSAIYGIQNIKCIDANFQEKNNFLILLPVSK